MILFYLVGATGIHDLHLRPRQGRRRHGPQGRQERLLPRRRFWQRLPSAMHHLETYPPPYSASVPTTQDRTRARRDVSAPSVNQATLMPHEIFRVDRHQRQHAVAALVNLLNRDRLALDKAHSGFLYVPSSAQASRIL